MNKVRGSGLWVLLVAGIAGILFITHHVATAATPETEKSGTEGQLLGIFGCFMAHCDSRMSDWAGMVPPDAGAQIIWHDTVTTSTGDPIGSGRGLGCVANGTSAVCTFGRLPQDFPNTPCEDVVDTLVAYGYAGNDGMPYRMWGSGTTLNCAAFSSAPLVLASGSVVAADNERIVRFGASGNLLWNTPTPGGRPISLVMSDSGVIVMGTAGGPVSIYDIATGTMLASLDLVANGGRYHTANTPAVRGDRIYISTNHNVDTSSGRLYAIDMVSSGGGLPDSLEVAWYYPFNGPSGTSPFAYDADMIYFDGDRDLAGADTPTIYALRDLGTTRQLLWTKGMPGHMEASFAFDRRGGMWAYSIGNPLSDNRWLYRLSMYDTNGDGIGDVLEQIDLDELVGETGVHVPSSAMTLMGTDSTPVMIVGASSSQEGGGVSSSYVVAVDLSAHSLLWKAQVPDNVSTAGQFPITTGTYGPRIFFTNQTNGTWTIGAPVAPPHDVIYLSSTTNGNVGGISFNDEDIISYDTGSGEWAMVFDGSDVGLTGDVDAFSFLADGSLLLSVDSSTTLGGISVDDSDIVHFAPALLGPNTSGTFSLYFDGSDVGLSTSGEDVDALHIRPDGRLVMSFVGSYNVSGASGDDEDLVLFSPVNLGTDTVGTWNLYLDASDVGLGNSSSEDTKGVWIDPANGDIYLTTDGNFSVSGVSGTGSDIFICHPIVLGSNASCDFEPDLYWDGSAYGFGSEVVDAIEIVR